MRTIPRRKTNSHKKHFFVWCTFLKCVTVPLMGLCKCTHIHDAPITILYQRGGSTPNKWPRYVLPQIWAWLGQAGGGAVSSRGVWEVSGQCVACIGIWNHLNVIRSCGSLFSAFYGLSASSHIFPHIFVWGSGFWFCIPPGLLPASASARFLSFTHNSFTHISLTHFFFTHRSSTHNSSTHISLSHTHTQSFTQLCYTQLCHTHTTLSHVSLSHTTLSNTRNSFTQISPTQLFHTSHDFLNFRSSTISFVFPAFSVPLQALFLIIGRNCDLWRGVIRSFNSSFLGGRCRMFHVVRLSGFAMAWALRPKKPRGSQERQRNPNQRKRRNCPRHFFSFASFFNSYRFYVL